MSEMGSCDILLIKVEWRTVSNAFVKSREKMWTNWFDVNIEHTVGKRAMTECDCN